MPSGFTYLPPSASPRWKAPVATSAALPASGNTSGDARVALNTQFIYVWSGSAWTLVGGGSGGTPGGSNTQVQYNSSNAFAGSANLTFDGTRLTANRATIAGLAYPSSDGDSNSVLRTNGSGTLSFGAVPAPSGGGADQQVIYNVGGGLGSSSNMKFNYTTRTLSLAASNSDIQRWKDISESVTYGAVNSIGQLQFGDTPDDSAIGNFSSRAFTTQNLASGTANFTTDQTDTAYAAGPDGTVHTYTLYNIQTIGGTPFYSATPLTVTATEHFGASNPDSVITYGTGSYTANGDTWDFDIYPLYNGVTQNSVGAVSTSVSDNGSTDPYYITLTWDVPVSGGTDNYLIVRTTDGVYQIVPNGNSFVDDNTSWVAGPAPTPGNVTFLIGLNWTNVTGPSSGVRIISGSNHHDTTYPAAAYVDDNTFDSGAVVTPTSFSALALTSSGETLVNTTGAVSGHIGAGFALVVDGDSAGKSGVGSYVDGQSAMFEGRVGNSRAFQVSNSVPSVGRNEPAVVVTAGILSAAYAQVGGSMDTNVTVVGTGANTTETSLKSYAVPQNSLVQHAHYRCSVHGTFASNANTKQLIWKWGSQTVLDSGAIAANGGDFEAVIEIYRTSSDANQYVKAWIFSSNATFGTVMAHISGTQDLAAGNVTLDFRGKNGTATANDIVTQQMFCQWLP